MKMVGKSGEWLIFARSAGVCSQQTKADISSVAFMNKISQNSIDTGNDKEHNIAEHTNDSFRGNIFADILSVGCRPVGNNFEVFRQNIEVLTFTSHIFLLRAWKYACRQETIQKCFLHPKK